VKGNALKDNTERKRHVAWADDTKNREKRNFEAGEGDRAKVPGTRAAQGKRDIRGGEDRGRLAGGVGGGRGEGIWNTIIDTRHPVRKVKRKYVRQGAHIRGSFQG